MMGWSAPEEGLVGFCDDLGGWLAYLVVHQPCYLPRRGLSRG